MDTNTTKAKNKAWQEVHKKFNELNGKPRDLNQLKIQWKNKKINARKDYSKYRIDINKTGGGEKPPSPSDADIEIKDMLNPAELLIDNNIYDSDSIILKPLELGSTSTSEDACCSFTLQSEGEPSCTYKLQEDCVEEQHNIDFEVITVPEDCQDKEIIDAPVADDISNKRNTAAKSLKFTKGRGDYIAAITSHTKLLKEAEHERKMEMAEEEHAIKMKIHKENLKRAVLEREIMEIKKRREENS